MKEEGGQDRSRRDTVSQTSKPALPVVAGGESEASISDKLKDHPDHVLIWEKSQQLAVEAAVSDNVISRCQIGKHGTGLFLSLESVLNILREQNGLIQGKSPVSKSSMLPKELWINIWFHTDVDTPLENLVGAQRTGIGRKPVGFYIGFFGFAIATASTLLQILGILSRPPKKERKPHDLDFRAAPGI